MSDRRFHARLDQQRRQALTELVGFVLLTIGLALYSIPLALIVAGAVCVAAGNLPVGRRR